MYIRLLRQKWKHIFIVVGVRRCRRRRRFNRRTSPFQPFVRYRLRIEIQLRRWLCFSREFLSSLYIKSTLR